MNRAILIGRLARDVEVKTISTTGNSVVNNAIAVNRYRTSNTGERLEETLFLDLVFYGRLAEIVGQYLRKGSKIGVEGYLQMQTWTDAQTNQNRSRIQLVVENMEMLDSKPADSQSQQQPKMQYQNPYERTPASPKPNYFTQQNQYEQSSSSDAEIPF